APTVLEKHLRIPQPPSTFSVTRFTPTFSDNSVKSLAVRAFLWYNRENINHPNGKDPEYAFFCQRTRYA
ncbi:MAG: hypothetical protein IKZ09_07040, partial [Clostridia bacterium]|nr:hypothetical protein [Clostridia bacterium]